MNVYGIFSSHVSSWQLTACNGHVFLYIKARVLKLHCNPVYSDLC